MSWRGGKVKLSHRATLMALSAVVAVVTLSGCAEPSETIVLTGANDGTKQRLAVDQELTITLEANPTTGYQWAVDGALPVQLEQVGESEYESGSSAIGAGGTEVWTFKGKQPGRGVLKLKYWRSFEPTAAPVDTFELTVDVE